MDTCDERYLLIFTHAHAASLCKTRFCGINIFYLKKYVHSHKTSQNKRHVRQGTFLDFAVINFLHLKLFEYLKGVWFAFFFPTLFSFLFSISSLNCFETHNA